MGRFYAAAPLVATSGHRMGTLCLGDAQPRTMSAEEVGHLTSRPLLALIDNKLGTCTGLDGGMGNVRYLPQ